MPSKRPRRDAPAPRPQLTPMQLHLHRHQLRLYQMQQLRMSDTRVLAQLGPPGSSAPGGLGRSSSRCSLGGSKELLGDCGAGGDFSQEGLGSENVMETAATLLAIAGRAAPAHCPPPVLGASSMVVDVPFGGVLFPESQQQGLGQGGAPGLRGVHELPHLQPPQRQPRSLHQLVGDPLLQGQGQALARAAGLEVAQPGAPGAAVQLPAGSAGVAVGAGGAGVGAAPSSAAGGGGSTAAAARVASLKLMRRLSALSVNCRRDDSLAQVGGRRGESKAGGGCARCVQPWRVGRVRAGAQAGAWRGV